MEEPTLELDYLLFHQGLILCVMYAGSSDVQINHYSL